VLNESAHDVEEKIEGLFADSLSDDLLLVHFSCHGLKSEAGELFFAARNTRPDRLGSTGIAADFIQRCIKSCRARSIVLFLDCCYGGAFGQGVSVRASGSANVLESFPAGKLGGGKGRAVITASSSMEYAFEGNTLADSHQQASVFTSALVEGLESGEADRDEDGLISLNELYEYVFDRVREANPNQTPSRDVEMAGELYLARSRRKRIRPVPIPAEVQAALLDPNMFTRLGAVSELRARLNGDDIAAALGAHVALTNLSQTDIKYVGDAADEALAGAAVRVLETRLSFGQIAHGGPTDPLTLHLSGPPVARSCTFSTTDRWIIIEEAVDGPRVSVDTSTRGQLRGSITVKGPTGEIAVPVSADVVAQVPEVAQVPVVVAQVPEVVAQVPEVVAEVPDVPPHPVSPDPVSTSPPNLPSVKVAAANGAGRLRLSGLVALAGGALMVLVVFLPFEYDSPLREKLPELLWYQVLVGLLALAAGVLTLVSRTTRWLGPGLVLAGAATSTWGVPSLIGDWVDRDGDGFNYGFVLALIAQLLVVAAGCLAAAGLVHHDGVHLGRLSRQDKLGWVITGLGFVGSLVLLSQAKDIGEATVWYGAQTAWAALLALVLPAGAVLVRPRRLGGSILAGWVGSAFGITAAWWAALGKDTSTPKIDFFFLTLLALGATTAAWTRQPTAAP